MKWTYPIGATPLDPDQMTGLIPDHIYRQKELNEWEAQNILEAEKWVYFSRKPKDLLTVHFLKSLHKKMFEKTWTWAGQWRKRQTNIGVEPYRILLETNHLIEEIRYWTSNKTYCVDEIALRFHHKLVWIHCFPNGNGRHARFMADLFLREQGKKPFTWGFKNLTEENEHRSRYLRALRAADNHDYSPLKEFVRS